jgi:plastocyanin
MGGMNVHFVRMGGFALASMLAGSCGSASPASPTPDGTHTVPRTIMIAEGDAFPTELTIAVGEQVTFMNHDQTSYTVTGGRGGSGRDCAEIDIVGVLAPGNIRSTERFAAAKTCDFHVSRAESSLVTGSIVVR